MISSLDSQPYYVTCHEKKKNKKKKKKNMDVVTVHYLEHTGTFLKPLVSVTYFTHTIYNVLQNMYVLPHIAVVEHVSVFFMKRLCIK